MELKFKKFTTLVARCSRVIKRIKSSEMSEFNLKSPHVSCLYYLYINEKPMTLKELCVVCDEDKSYISKALETLENDGYIECYSKTEKRYNSPIQLTAKGIEVAEKVTNKANKIAEMASEGLSNEERLIFYTCFNSILSNLENIIEKYGE